MSFITPNQNALLLPDCGIRAQFLPHIIADAAQERIKFFIETGYERDSTNVMTMVGPSGSGKSQIIKDLMRQDEFKVQTGSGDNVRPIVYAEVPSDTSRKGILQKILKALGIDVKTKTASVSDLMAQAHLQLREQKCRLLVLDEAQQMAKPSNLYEYADFIRQFVNEGTIPLLLIGLPDTIHLTQQNEQMGRRSKVPLCYGALDWKQTRDKQAIDEILENYENTLKAANRPYPVTHPDVARALYRISGGLISRKSQLLAHALDLAYTTPSKLLTYEILKQAYKDIQLLYSSLQKVPCPFTYGVEDEDLIVAAFDTGAKAPAPRTKTKAKP